MPTVFTHAAVPIALAAGLGRNKVPVRLLACGAIAAMLPDLDVIGLRLGVPYTSDFGHRGFTHSLLFAALVALAGASAHRWLRTGFYSAWLFLFAAIASHGLLDTLTNGGRGIALLWPWTSERYFAPFRPIEVSPLGVHGFFTTRGIEALKSELLWIWLPVLAAGMALFIARRAIARRNHMNSTPEEI